MLRSRKASQFGRIALRMADENEVGGRREHLETEAGQVTPTASPGWR